MNKNELASILDGRQYQKEISKQEKKLAKENKLVVVFAASDDLMEFRGAIYDETYEKTYVSKNGIIRSPVFDKYKECLYLNEQYKFITPIWGDNESEFYHCYETNIPHATFKIFDDKEPYCQGIVFSLDELD